MKIGRNFSEILGPKLALGMSLALGLLIMTPALRAQTQGDDLDLNLDAIEAESAKPPDDITESELKVVETPAKKLRKNSAGQGRGIYIVNQATQASAQNQESSAMQNALQKQVQKQPITNVEANPLGESRAEQIRKARQHSEVKTEEKIVEKLEESRMDDETKRADVLFGDKFETLKEKNKEKQEPKAAQPVVVPVQQVEVPAADQTDLIREEVRAQLDSKKAEKAVDTESKSYFAGLVGYGSYNAQNVRSQGSIGVGVGSRVRDRVLFEGDFIYSNFKIDTGFHDMYGREYPYNVDSYSVMGILKFQAMTGLVRPIVGAAMSYNYRTFQNPFLAPGTTVSSSTLDLGIDAGLDVELSPGMFIGIDWRYMWNTVSKTDDYAAPSGYTAPLDSLSYTMYALSLKFTY